MGKVLSIDLAYRRVRDLGICLIEEHRGRPTTARFVDPKGDLGFKRPPSAQELAETISNYCHENEIRVLLLDGPQGWKDPSSNLKECRYCERILNTPGKTGVRPQTKPKNWRDFAEYSVSLFDSMVRAGGELVRTPVISFAGERLLVIESFPAGAWQMLCMSPLRAEWRKKPAALKGRLKTLQRLYGFRCEGCLTHDGLQALVAGLAGVAILAGNAARYIALGVPPNRDNGVTVEGFIVCPRRVIRRQK